MQWNTMQLQKERSDAICGNMDGPRDDHSKWNKAERQINTTWYHLPVESEI